MKPPIRIIVEMPVPTIDETHAIVWMFPTANKIVVQRGRLEGVRFFVSRLSAHVVYLAERPDLSDLWTRRYGFNESLVERLLSEEMA